MPKARILILCTGNSCRSQMAEAFLQAHDQRLYVRSAGSEPASAVHPCAIACMAEAGFDLSQARPKSVELYRTEPWDYVISVCDNAQRRCPAFLGQVGHRLHIGFADPAEAQGSPEEVMSYFRRIRDEIRAGMEAFLRSLPAGRQN